MSAVGKPWICLCTALAISALVPPSRSAAQERDLKLSYDKPAMLWTDALPLGNGRIGAMVFGRLPEERIQFNEETLWTGGPRDYNKPGAVRYLPEIRKLLAEGKQAAAEKLAGEQFLGAMSPGGDRVAWLVKMRAIAGTREDPARADFNDSTWPVMNVPSYEGWEDIGYEGLDGAVWFRTTFDLPAGWQGKDLVLDLNRIREHDFTYVNGRLVGSMNSLDPRKYAIPAEVLRPGKNVIAVQVINYYDKGGIAGYKDTTRHIAVYQKDKPGERPISLVKKWRYWVQDANPPATARYQADYQPFGDLWISTSLNAPKPRDYSRELDLETAVASTRYRQNGVNFVRDYFVSQPDQALVVHFSADKKASISFDAGLASPHQNYRLRRIDARTLALTVNVKNGALRGESFLQVKITGGRVIRYANHLRVRNADAATLYLVAATTYKRYDDLSGDPEAACQKALRALEAKSYADVKRAHIAEYQSYFKKLDVRFGTVAPTPVATDQRIRDFAKGNDPSFAALYLQYGRYLLISSSRPGTRPANLQGIWNDLLTPPWGSKYTTNINAEMNYWPAESLNLSACHEPLFTMISELAETGKETAREYYGAPGWVEHHNTDLWRGTAPINASNHGIWVTGGAWLCQHLWEHFRFTRDTAFLRDKAYPVMRSAAEFFNAFLVKDPKTGWLISTPSNSPEHGGLVAGPAMDHQIIRDLFKNCIEAAAILHTDKEFSEKLSSNYKQIAPDQVGKFGQLQEWLEDKDDTSDTHRHVSHLWAVYPGTAITWDQSPDLMKAARQSLLYRGDLATGWSLAWKINLWARFKDGDHAWELLKTLIRPVGNPDGGGGSYVNLFDAHPPFQIDGNFGAAAGIGEMLVQSHEGYISLLPALPKALPGGAIRGIIARGGFRLDLAWANGKLTETALYATASGPCRLRYLGKERSFNAVKGATYRFNGQLDAL